MLAAATLAGVVVCVLLAEPFLGAATWALALAVLFAPLHARIEGAVGNASLAALASVAIVGLVIVLPGVAIIERLVAEAASGAASVRALLASGAAERLLQSYPVIMSAVEWFDEKIGLPTIVGNFATWLSTIGTSFARGSVAQLVEVAVTVYLFFFFLRDRRDAARLLRDWSPLDAAEQERFSRRVVDTIHATIYGTVLVGAVQGTLGGLMFWFLGLPAPLLWGVVMALLSIVPVLGSFVVWIPAAILLGLGGAWGKALILAAWGAFVVGTIDNLLRPVLVGNRLRLHPVTLFVSMIGGVFMFGAPGFILGPLAVTVTLLLVEIWRARIRATDEAGKTG